MGVVVSEVGSGEAEEGSGVGPVQDQGGTEH